MPSVAQSLKQTYHEGVNPRTRRYGLFCGLYANQAEMDSSLSGQSAPVMPIGEMLRFDSADLSVDNFKIFDADWTKKEMKEFTAQWFITNVKRHFDRMGFVELDPLTPLEDEDAERYFAQVHPSSLECFEGLQFCSTCRIKVLQSAGYTDPVAEELRLRCLQGYVAASDYYNQRWAQINHDLAAGKVKMTEGEHHIRKNLHQPAPEQIQAQALAESGRATAAGIVEGLTALADKQTSGDSETKAMLLQLAQSHAAAEVRHAEEMTLLRQMLVNQNSVNVTTAKVDKRTREYKESQNESTSQTGNESSS